MAKGRKVVSMMKKHLTKAEINQRKEQEARYKAGRDQLMSPPKWLSPIAVREFNRIVEIANDVDFLDNLDVSILAVYCSSYAQVIDAEAHLQAEGAVIVNALNRPVVNPYVGVRDKAEQKMIQCSAKLGLATIDRLKLMAPEKPEKKKENKFVEFLEG